MIMVQIYTNMGQKGMQMNVVTTNRQERLGTCFEYLVDDVPRKLAVFNRFIQLGVAIFQRSSQTTKREQQDQKIVL